VPNSAQSKQKGRSDVSDPNGNHEVTRHEFNEVRRTVSEMQGAISTLLEVSQSQERAITKVDNSIAQVVEQINSLARMQAASQGASGTIQVSNLWHGLGFVATFAVVLGGIIMFAIRAEMTHANSTVQHNAEKLKALSVDIAAHVKDGHPDRVVALVNRLSDQLNRHESSDGHPEITSRVSSLEQTVQANHLENETQHRWIADVIGLQADWEYRTRGLEVMGPHHRPLVGIGSQSSAKIK
jgi:hypothetical protein